MNAPVFAALPERAFHIAEAENWPSIRCSGLHSTKVLIERAGLNGAEAAQFVGYRRDGMRLPSGVRIRDQRPMPPRALERCLDAGLTPAAWYQLVNSKVYFWLDTDRVRRHLTACGARPQLVITVDLHRLLLRHGERAFVTPFNVGNARRRPASRGYRTFVPLAAWLMTRWRAEAKPGGSVRPGSHRPVELAIDGSVEDLTRFIVSKKRMEG